MNLGRYLLAAVIIGFFTREALVWAGAWSPYSTQSFAQSEEAPALTREAVVLVVQTLESQPGSIAITLVMAGLLSLLLRRLFRAELSGWGKALALGSFLAGHITILGAAMRLIYAPLTLALTGRPAELSLSLSLGLGAVYAGIVTYGCFGSGWWSAVKGLFGLGWATAEIASLSCLGTVACALRLAWTRPSHYAVPEEGLPAFSAAMAGVAVAFSLPLLLHAATEAYYRLG